MSLFRAAYQPHDFEKAPGRAGAAFNAAAPLAARCEVTERYE